MRATALRVAGAVVALALLLAGTGVRARDAAPANTTPLRLQLKWRHQFQFAGFYTALEKGYYRQAGLDVTITPLQPGTDPVDIVLARGADLGVASSELVLRYAKGDPVVVLATIFQHSPLALFVRSDIGIETPQDLAGHKVALAPWESEIFAYLQREHVSISQLQIVEHDHTVDSLLKGRVDALAGYETDESYYLQRSGRAFRQFTPRSSGVDFYGDTLFTTRAMVNEHPERIEAFVAASLRGWEYALAHQDEIATLIHAKYAPDLPVEKLRFEAASMLPLVRTDLVELGHTHIARWQHIFDVYRGLGLAGAGGDVDLSGLIYRRAQPTDWRWLLWVLAVAALSLAVLTWIARRFYRITGRLREQLDENRRLQDELRALTITDPLTGLRNRRHFDTVCSAEWERARRAQRPVTVLFIDIDFFKSYNDSHGHGAGDDCIAAVGRAIDQSLQRPADVAARYGGDEFVVLLPDTDLDGALDVARRIEAAIRALGLSHARSRFGRITLSIGVAQQVPEPNHRPQEMLQRADRALYAAKQAGRNRIMPAPQYLFDQRAAQ
ncbi:MAG TPA: diguanylate cyclase [Casimicrobiaceae bacterium]|jgi:diguanylate cyclase (GGDEF)-like protein|nr:diguanylate cyclase [Casimicrobiaceae bacterium]